MSAPDAVAQDALTGRRERPAFPSTQAASRPRQHPPLPAAEARPAATHDSP